MRNHYKIILGAAAWLVRDDPAAFTAALIALVGAQLTSYIRAKAESLGFEATVQWCAAGPHGFVHGLGALQASKEAWDRLLSFHGVPAGDA